MGVVASDEGLQEEIEFARYQIAYSELEAAVRFLADWAIASTQGHSGDSYSVVRQMVHALTSEMTFYALEESIATIIDIRAGDLSEESRVGLQKRWKLLRGSLANERGIRNAFAHSAVTIEEDVGYAVVVKGKKDRTYTAEQLQKLTKRVRSLMEKIQALAQEVAAAPLGS
ncbi:MAG: hypothetical protein O2895_00920 [Chloroflexi bacterium]|nr:hypothetical protein [Chloroflexota bacterium]